MEVAVALFLLELQLVLAVVVLRIVVVMVTHQVLVELGEQILVAVVEVWQLL